jgi:5-methylcytosine-specific restriction endonuclease McrA
MQEFVCQHCNKSFKKYEKSSKFCSRECWRNGHVVWNKGKKLNYLPPTSFKKGEMIGEKHHMWKGGKWCWARRETIKRDNGTCQYCGLIEQVIMDVAHIIPTNGDKNRRYGIHDLNNLITLCPNCHRRFDKGIIELKDHSAHLKNSANSVKEPNPTPS